MLSPAGRRGALCAPALTGRPVCGTRGDHRAEHGGPRTTGGQSALPYDGVGPSDRPTGEMARCAARLWPYHRSHGEPPDPGSRPAARACDQTWPRRWLNPWRRRLMAGVWARPSTPHAASTPRGRGLAGIARSSSGSRFARSQPSVLVDVSEPPSSSIVPTHPGSDPVRRRAYSSSASRIIDCRDPPSRATMPSRAAKRSLGRLMVVLIMPRSLSQLPPARRRAPRFSTRRPTHPGPP